MSSPSKSSPQKRLDSLRSYSTLVHWFWQTGRSYRLQSLLNILLGGLMVVADLSFVWATKLAIDIATGSDHRFTLSQAIALIVCLIVIQMAINISSRWVRAILGVRAQNDMQQRLFNRLLKAEWRPLRKIHTGHLINRLERDVTDVVRFITESLPSLVTTLFQFVGAFLFLFWMDRTLACIVILVLPIFLLTSKLYMKRMRRITHDVRNTESHLQTILQESLQHTLVIKTLGRISTMTQRLTSGQATLRGHVVRRTKYSTFSSGLMNLGFATGYVLTFTWGVVHLQEGLITYGSLIAFVQLVGQIQTPVRALTQFIPVFIGAFTAAERIIELQQIPLEKHLPDEQAQQSQTPPLGIVLSDITYHYEKGAREIFRHFSYVFPPGSITAIQGETGAGKTTLIRLLLALVSPNEGSVGLFTGAASTDAADLCRSPQFQPITAAHRNLFSYVPQGNTLLSGTIRDNLLLGNPAATEQEMCEALRTAAADFVFDLPDGLNTSLSEMGVGLSEGQAQRISIARALLRPAPILLLDEATSSLDAATERRVLQSIIQNHQGRTLLFVTHRPEVLRYCTQTLELRK